MMSVGAPDPIPEFVEHVTHPGFEFVRLYFALRWFGDGHVSETETFGEFSSTGFEVFAEGMMMNYP